MINSFRYQPYYCEENIWQLAKKFSREKGEANDERNGEVWFLINNNQTIATAQQRAVDANSFVIWDYHVVYYSPDKGVFDLDTRCSFPCAVDIYLEASFLSLVSITPREYSPHFRVIPASEYLSLFSSNREHMLDENGNYLQPPPQWSAIGEGNNLASFTDFNNKSIGEIISLKKLISRFF